MASPLVPIRPRRPAAIVAVPLVAASLATATAAMAHDTWFERLPVDPAVAASSPSLLALGTGNRFPRHETGIDARHLAVAGCNSVVGEPQPLRPLGDDPTALRLQAGADAASCWAQTDAFEVELPADKIEIYLREIGAGSELRATWSAMRSRGLTWKERYAKHARIELGASPSAQPAPMALDLAIESAGAGPVTAGAPLVLRLLRDGRPLAALPVELRSENSAFGLWRRSDDAGRVEIMLPLPGRWIARAVDLRVDPADPDRWDSRFVTLAFDVRPAGAAQNGSSFTSNARSANQTEATAAIASDPASSTPRR